MSTTRSMRKTRSAIRRNRLMGLRRQTGCELVLCMPLNRALLLFSIFLLVTFGHASIAFSALQFETVSSDLELPTSIKHAGDGSGRLFVTLQKGRIAVIDGKRVLPDPFLDVTRLTSCCGERGLLDVAFHPSYAKNGLLFINHTDTNGNTVVARYKVSANPSIVDPDSRTILLTVRQPYPNHNGGQLQFGPDGYLYIGMGDGGWKGDPGNRAQDLGALLGKMLRIDVNGQLPYAIPPDNPFVGKSGALPEIWAYGLRNPWRFSFDRRTGEMWIGDVGQDKWEEVNIQPAGSKGGENYGWRIMEGNHCFKPAKGCKRAHMVMPILEYGRSMGCSLTGGYVYRGSKIPELLGAYVYGDYCSGRIWGARPANGQEWTSAQLDKTEFMISTFGEDEAGELYVADHDKGAVHRIIGLSKE